MARAESAPVPVMTNGKAPDQGGRARSPPDAQGAGKAGEGQPGCQAAADPRWGVGRELHGANDDGTSIGPELAAPVHHAGRPSLRRDRMGDADRGHRQRDRQDRLRAEGRRGPQGLEPARDQRRREQVLPRARRDARAREQRPPAHRPRGQHHRGLGRDPALLRDGRGPPVLPGGAHAPPRAPEDGVQLAGLVQRRESSRSRSAPPASSTPSRTTWAASWTSPRPRPCSSSSAGRRQQPLPHPLEPREDDRRRHRQRPGELHAAATTPSPA